MFPAPRARSPRIHIPRVCHLLEICCVKAEAASQDLKHCHVSTEVKLKHRRQLCTGEPASPPLPKHGSVTPLGASSSSLLTTAIVAGHSKESLVQDEKIQQQRKEQKVQLSSRKMKKTTPSQGSTAVFGIVCVSKPNRRPTPPGTCRPDG